MNNAFSFLKIFFDLLKSLPLKWNVKIWLTFLTIGFIFLSSIQFNLFNINKLLKLNMNFETRQTVTRDFNHIVQQEMHNFVVYLGKTLDKVEGANFIFEYIKMENTATISNPKFLGYVMYAMTYDKEIKRPIEARDKMLLKIRDYLVYSEASSQWISSFAKKTPLTQEKMVADLAILDKEGMYEMFYRRDEVNNAYGNFIGVKIFSTAVSFVLNSSDQIIGHAVLLLNEEAYSHLKKHSAELNRVYEKQDEFTKNIQIERK